jgi:hypothetical protein
MTTLDLKELILNICSYKSKIPRCLVVLLIQMSESTVNVGLKLRKIFRGVRQIQGCSSGVFRDKHSSSIKTR